jgi:hypothetical protein
MKHIIGFIGTFLFGIVTGFVNAFVLTKLYGWFVLTVIPSAQVFTLKQTWGLSFLIQHIIGMCLLGIHYLLSKDAYAQENILKTMVITQVSMILYSVSCLFSGYVLHLIIR